MDKELLKEYENTLRQYQEGVDNHNSRFPQDKYRTRSTHTVDPTPRKNPPTQRKPN